MPATATTISGPLEIAWARACSYGWAPGCRLMPPSTSSRTRPMPFRLACSILSTTTATPPRSARHATGKHGLWFRCRYRHRHNRCEATFKPSAHPSFVLIAAVVPRRAASYWSSRPWNGCPRTARTLRTSFASRPAATTTTMAAFRCLLRRGKDC